MRYNTLVLGGENKQPKFLKNVSKNSLKRWAKKYEYKKALQFLRVMMVHI